MRNLTKDEKFTIELMAKSMGSVNLYEIINGKLSRTLDKDERTTIISSLEYIKELENKGSVPFHV